MSTEYYLRIYPEKRLKSKTAIKCRRTLIKEHDLNHLWKIISILEIIDDETVKVINRGVRGPYPNGSLYCGFKFEDELRFWRNAVERFPENAWLNLIFAEYLVQEEKEYKTAHTYYKKAFEINYRLIFSIEPSWRDKLIQTDFDYELYYLRTQKDDYDKEDFKDEADKLFKKYDADDEKIKRIKTIAKI